MKKLLLMLTALSITLSIQPYSFKKAWQKTKSTASSAWEGTKSAASSTASATKAAAQKTASVAESAAQKTKAVVVSGAKKTASVAEATWKKTKDIVANPKESFESAQAVAASMSDTFKKMMAGHPKPAYCNHEPLQPYAPTIDNPQVIAADQEDMIATIKKYSPIAYLCNELYGPVAVEDYFNAPTTQLVYQKGHSQNPDAPKEIIIPAGQVTGERIYEVAKARNFVSDDDLFFDIAECTKFGSNPAKFNDGQGNLTVPAYVMWYEAGDEIWINYIFNYALNGPYTIKVPGTGLPMLKGDIKDFQNAHEFDLEHATVVVDKQTRQMKKIFFAAHGSAEGVWLNAGDPNIQLENGTHPVVYVANGGHGSYPRAGTVVRVYGFANDHQCKTQRWTPQWVLVYPESDPRFNPQTMGWAMHAGNYGKRGVSSLKGKGWYLNTADELRSGRPIDEVPHCSLPTGALDKARYEACTFKKRKQAKPPH